MATRIFGSGIRRREDPRLITGSATYTDDLTLPGMVHAAMLRSPHAHARIVGVDTSLAEGRAGRCCCICRCGCRSLRPSPCAWLLPNADLKVATYPCVAIDIVRYVGDIVAVVVADTPYQAYDALELIDVEYATAAVCHRSATGDAGWRTSVPRRCAQQHGVPLDSQWRGRRRGLCPGGGGVRGTDYSAAADSESDGAARHDRQMEWRVRRVDAVEHDPEPAHPAVPRLRRGRHS